MGKFIKLALAFSLGFNIVFLAIGGTLVYKKGGFSYVLQKATATVIESTDENPAYPLRKSVFEQLPKSKGAIVFIGDSITDGNEWSEYFPNELILNRGISGDTTNGVLERLQDVIDLRPSKIFLMVGVNDLYKGRNVDSIAENYKRILEKLHNELPTTDVFIESVLPVNEELLVSNVTNKDVVEANGKIKKLAFDYGMTYIDLHSLLVTKKGLSTDFTADGLHPNGKVYSIWADAIKKYIVSD